MADSPPSSSRWSGDATVAGPGALLIGCSRFEGLWDTALATPEPLDALSSLERALGAENVHLLLDPTTDEAGNAIQSFLAAGARDRAFSMIVLATLGLTGSDGELRLAMRDTRADDLDKTSLPMAEVLRWAIMVAQPVLVVVDSANSGLAIGLAERIAAEPRGRYLRREEHLAVLTSSGGTGQSAIPAQDSLFLSTLALALEGGAGYLAQPDGGINVRELHGYLVGQLGTLKTRQPLPEPQLLVLGDPTAFTFPVGQSWSLPPGEGEKLAEAPGPQDKPVSPDVQASSDVQEEPPPQVRHHVESGQADEPTPRFELDLDSQLVMARSDAVRVAAGRDQGEPLDVVLGGLVSAPTTLQSGIVPYLRDLLESVGTPQRPYEQVLREAREQFGPPEGAEPDFLDEASLLRHRPILDLATSIARRTSQTSRVQTSHLLAAALTTTELPSDLVTVLGADRAELSARLLDSITRDPSAGDPQAWASVLGPAELVSAFASDYVPARARGWRRTSAEKLSDHLDVDTYVTMLAAMIARRSTAMPVSIGLFGEWGSGKSYFMELLRQKVDQLSTTPTTGSVYCQEIIQVTFNAWSYADTNLWASLAADFFSQLAAPETDPDAERRARIEESLKDTNQLRQELLTAREAAEKRTTEVHERYAAAVMKRESSSRTLTARLAVEVLADETVKKCVTELEGALGLGPGHSKKVLGLAQDIQGTVNDLAATRRVLAQRSLRWPFLLLLLAVFAVFAAVLLPDGPWAWVQWLKSSGALAGVLAFLTSFGTVVATSRKAVDGLRQVANAADEARERVLKDSGTEVSHLESELRQAEAEEAVARAQLQELDATIAQLDKELAEYEPGRRLYQFIAERAASLDYRGQLGVVSLVRRDFEQLVELMHRWRTAPAAGVDTPKPIDRIVLYIDDLDRCEPEQVVQVLQAVHLLLAMDLFVVVVGVDPRWLLRALRTRYAGILDLHEADADAGDAGFATSTPHDYLEKIFQVPFVLPPMTDTGFKDLIRSFVQRSGETQQASGSAAARSAVPGEPSIIRAADDTAGRGPSDVPEAFQVEPGSQIAPSLASSGSGSAPALTPITSTPVTTREFVLLGALAPLVRTPRAATRMFNIYGLLRSAKDLTPEGTFLGTRNRPGDYQAVIQLLGILTARPRLLGVILWGDPDGDPADPRGLCRMQGPGSWKQFVASLEPVKGSAGSWSNGVTATIEPVELGDWRGLVAALSSIRDLVSLDDIERYRVWGPQVARFSFQLSAFADPD